MAEDEEGDAVDQMLRKAGCLDAHYAVQECIVEHKDWRVCQKQVTAFKECIDNSKKAAAAENNNNPDFSNAEQTVCLSRGSPCIGMNHGGPD